MASNWVNTATPGGTAIRLRMISGTRLAPPHWHAQVGSHSASVAYVGPIRDEARGKVPPGTTHYADLRSVQVALRPADAERFAGELAAAVQAWQELPEVRLEALIAKRRALVDWMHAEMDAEGSEREARWSTGDEEGWARYRNPRIVDAVESIKAFDAAHPEALAELQRLANEAAGADIWR